MDFKLLNKINSPNDLKALDDKDIPLLCDEIRKFLVENVGRSGGHLASNLGVTELTVAIHRIFNSPDDHIIFDVGHQAYVHKILTGRRDSFDSLRKPGGLSGFTRSSESEHDPFGAGHSSTSISAALGFAEADRLENKSNHTVALLGDGAYTGGMVHEALNNCDPDLKMIIILNENGMSISVNKGTFAGYLSRVRISKGYLGWKKGTNSFLSHIPLIGKPIKAVLSFVRDAIKTTFFSSNYFEDLGLYYIGPIDGNDYKKVEKTLKKAKELGKTVIVHVKTVKGKGYEPAEESPDGFHSISSGTNKKTSFHSVFANELVALAEKDKDIVAVTPAMGMGTGLDQFGAIYPERYFDVGIAEDHAVTFSAGLAANGKKPFAAIYSTFLQRAYDSVVHDVALQNLPVKIMVDRAGLSVADGATHHGIFDVSYLSHIPNVEIYSPISYTALRETIKYAAECNSPIAVRYPNRTESQLIRDTFYSDGISNLSYKLDYTPKEAPKRLFITYGSIVENVIYAKKLLKEKGVESGIVLLERLKPYEATAEAIFELLCGAERILFVEEGIRNGGAGMLLRDALDLLGFDFNKSRYEILAINDFAAPEKPCDLYDYVGLSSNKIAEKMMI